MVMAEPIIVRVGNYDIVRTIGKGNFASVKLARHRIAKNEVGGCLSFSRFSFVLTFFQLFFCMVSWSLCFISKEVDLIL